MAPGWIQEEDRERCSDQALGVSNAQIALASLLHQPGVMPPSIGALKAHHLVDAIAAIGLKLEPAELKSRKDPFRPHPIFGHS
jgi:1-deoxyxylulose-5-phosphate synthase